MKFTVTSKDIRKGKRCASGTCPIALSMARTLQVKVSVWTSVCYVFAFGKLETLRKYALPAEVSQFVEDFDKGDIQVFPFEFEIPGIPEIQG